MQRLRMELRGKRGAALIASLRVQVEMLPAAVLAADNSGRYIAANRLTSELTGYSESELLRQSVFDLTSAPNADSARSMWHRFIEQGSQRGDYVLMTKAGAPVAVRYQAFASIAPGVHISLLTPAN